MKLNNLDLNKLYAFAAVVEQGGVGAAAARLGRTPSAVSQSVSALEGALGVKLFDRVGKRLVPTRGGQLLHGHLREYQAALQRTVDMLVNESGDVHGLVRVGVYLGFPRLRLALFLTRFRARHPQVQLRVVYAPQEDLNARLLRNRLDFALALRARPEGHAQLQSTHLFEEALVLVASRRFFRRGFDLAALARTPVIDYYQSDPLIERWIAHHYGARRSGRRWRSGRRPPTWCSTWCSTMPASACCRAPSPRPTCAAGGWSRCGPRSRRSPTGSG